jgi:cytochrome c oxidase cbb3-type subunit 3
MAEGICFSPSLKSIGKMRTNFNKLAASLVLALMASPVVAFAQEKDFTPPWRNVVSADDTFIFYVLAGLALLLLVLIWVVAGVTKGLTSDSGIWKSRWNANAIAALVAMGSFLALPTATFAQDAVATASAPLFEMSDGLFWIMLAINGFLALVLFLMLYNLNMLIQSLRPAAQVSGPTIFEKIEKALTASVPIEREADIMTDHSYDGIRELDNRLPPWWLYMFYICIAFAVVYLYHFQVSPIPGLDKMVLLGPIEKGTQAEQYELAMAEGAAAKAAYMEKAGNLVNETSVTMLTDAASLAKGQETFVSLCQACHGANAAGATNSVGPNLTDGFWLHGGGVQNIFKTIKYGVVTKGMISWEAQLSPRQMQEVSSWIWSLQGTTVEGGKEPQGEPWSEAGTAAPAPVAETDSAAVEVTQN